MCNCKNKLGRTIVNGRITQTLSKGVKQPTPAPVVEETIIEEVIEPIVDETPVIESVIDEKIEDVPVITNEETPVIKEDITTAKTTIKGVSKK
jgi:hypothetical protein